jgi:hypothetical protein
MYAEMQDITIPEIVNLGKWSTSQCEEASSTRLPMKAFRVMGGHCLARGALTPPEELQKKSSPLLMELWYK